MYRRLARPKDDKRVDFISAMLADGRENVLSQEEVAAQGQNLVCAFFSTSLCLSTLITGISSSAPFHRTLGLTHSHPYSIAGSETTATTLSAVTYFLMKHPKVYSRFKAEIREKFAQYTDITSNAVGGLPYFHAVINETMRLYPPVPFGPPRLSPGAYVDGKFVPKGVGLLSYPIEEEQQKKEECMNLPESSYARATITASIGHQLT